METLILLRHGKAVREHEAKTDRARGLTPRGQQEAAEAGRRIAEDGLRPDRVLVSSAQRTRETLLALVDALGKPHVKLIDDLYMADAETIWREAIRSGGKRVLVIGHNPGIHDLAADLVAQDGDRSAAARRVREHMPTASYVAYSINGSTMEAAGARMINAWSPR